MYLRHADHVLDLFQWSKYEGTSTALMHLISGNISGQKGGLGPKLVDQMSLEWSRDISSNHYG